MTTRPGNNKVVSYFYDNELGNYSYGGGNPMRPHRARLVYSLLKSYGLTSRMSINTPPEAQAASFDQLTEFHADDYIDFLRMVTPNNAEDHLNQLKRFNMGQIGDVDCPVFDGVYEYCQIYAGASVSGAANLAAGKADIAFNWSGGMHHAKKAEASGFCYVNDIVLAILELLKVFSRVLYVDIDIHHGDGVEEAFYLTDRVMTVSFHKYGEFFPGTGALADIGYGKGKYYCVNVPLKDGMDDDNYQMLYEPIMAKVMEMYQPGAIVMCCGADSLSGDKLGCFNLSMEGHSNCIEFLAKYNVPMLVLGGGGYTLRNVARCWCYETGRLMGVDLPDELPEGALNEYNYYLDTGSLRISTSNMKNMNSKEDLLEIKRRVLENLGQLPPVPSAHMSYQPAPQQQPLKPEEDMDARGGGEAHENARRVKPGDESDNEEEAPHGVRTDVSYQGAKTETKMEVKAEPVVKQEPTSDPSTQAAMQPATLATSEALQGSGAAGTATAVATPQVHAPAVVGAASNTSALTALGATAGPAGVAGVPGSRPNIIGASWPASTGGPQAGVANAGGSQMAGVSTGLMAGGAAQQLPTPAAPNSAAAPNAPGSF